MEEQAEQMLKLADCKLKAKSNITVNTVGKTDKGIKQWLKLNNI